MRRVLLDGTHSSRADLTGQGRPYVTGSDDALMIGREGLERIIQLTASRPMAASSMSCPHTGSGVRERGR